MVEDSMGWIYEIIYDNKSVISIIHNSVQHDRANILKLIDTLFMKSWIAC